MMKVHIEIRYGIYHLTPHFLSYLQNKKEFEGKISDFHQEKDGLSFETKKVQYFRLSRGGENVIRDKAL